MFKSDDGDVYFPHIENDRYISPTHEDTNIEK